MEHVHRPKEMYKNWKGKREEEMSICHKLYFVRMVDIDVTLFTFSSISTILYLILASVLTHFLKFE